MAAHKHSFLFQYCPKHTYIHRLSAGSKLCIMCFLSFMLHSSSQYLLVGSMIFLIIIAGIAQLSFKTIKKNCVFLCFYLCFIFLMKVLGSSAELYTNIMETLFFMQKLAIILFAASIFYETTSKLAILILCEKIESFLCRKRCTKGIGALTFTLMLICIPRVFEIWAQLNYAYDARTDTNRHRVAAFYRVFFLLPTLIEHLLHFAFTAEQAINNRTSLSIPHTETL